MSTTITLPDVVERTLELLKDSSLDPNDVMADFLGGPRISDMPTGVSCKSWEGAEWKEYLLDHGFKEVRGSHSGTVFQHALYSSISLTIGRLAGDFRATMNFARQYRGRWRELYADASHSLDNLSKHTLSKEASDLGVIPVDEDEFKLWFKSSFWDESLPVFGLFCESNKDASLDDKYRAPKSTSYNVERLLKLVGQLGREANMSASDCAKAMCDARGWDEETSQKVDSAIKLGIKFDKAGERIPVDFRVPSDGIEVLEEILSDEREARKEDKRLAKEKKRLKRAKRSGTLSTPAATKEVAAEAKVVDSFRDQITNTIDIGVNAVTAALESLHALKSIELPDLSVDPTNKLIAELTAENERLQLAQADSVDKGAVKEAAKEQAALERQIRGMQKLLDEKEEQRLKAIELRDEACQKLKDQHAEHSKMNAEGQSVVARLSKQVEELQASRLEAGSLVVQIFKAAQTQDISKLLGALSMIQENAKSMAHHLEVKLE